MARLEICPHLKNCAYQHFEKAESYLDVVSTFARLYYVIEGKGQLNFLDQRIDLAPNNLYLIPSFARCTYIFEPGLKQYYIHLDTLCSNGLPMALNFQLKTNRPTDEFDLQLIKKIVAVHPLHALRNAKPEVYQKKDWLQKEMGYRSAAVRYETQGILLKLLSGFILGTNPKISANPHFHSITPLLQFIEEHIGHNLTLAGLAAQSKLSKPQLTQIFLALFDKSPTVYILEKRLEKSKTLIVNTNQNLQLIAEQCGFKSYSYFCKQFKNAYGLAPLKYRHSH
ncbi:helix-turn-helix domain-containing protein [Sediminicola luteus]|uniref:HTH araC/xylS-type domain-containing protein n=1 Tax=Sediminicola luteus TaxID=319238 RepID=A0A2A4GC25_9FLAO|nr:AraC family transcriptional regulator [Sediminicola luteus]PCE66003.1 hypothetical protein B7P33_01495 [Sediminicola luteus]